MKAFGERRVHSMTDLGAQRKLGIKSVKRVSLGLAITPAHCPRPNLHRVRAGGFFAFHYSTYGHVPDEAYEAAKQQFTDEELVNLTWAAIAINGWNRVAIAVRSVSGEYQPAAHKT